MSAAQGWAAALVGNQVGDYILDDFISAGGFGFVYRGKNVNTGSDVAIKILDPEMAGDPRLSGQFNNESVLLRKLLNRSHVINWIDSGIQTVTATLAPGVSVPVRIHFLVMSLASGVLSEITMLPEDLSKIAWGERISHWRGAILGVHQMHLSTVAHRDIKAENCLLMAGTHNSIEVRVADLGRSKDYSTGPVQHPFAYLTGMGDLSHAAPEFLHLQGGNTGESFLLADLFGLGSLLVELATGHAATTLALGSWRAVAEQARRDYANRISRDLSTLRPHFRRACAEAAEEVPTEIRADVASLLEQLCDPVPQGRLPRWVGKRRGRDEGIKWLIDRADILGRRLRVETKKSHNRKRDAG